MTYALTILDNQGYETFLTASHKQTLLDDVQLLAATNKQQVVDLGEGVYRLQCKVTKRVKQVAVIERVESPKVS